jgi:hypothetical protein
MTVVGDEHRSRREGIDDSFPRRFRSEIMECGWFHASRKNALGRE